MTANGAVDAVVAGDGTLAYVAGGAVALAGGTLVWVDRQGRETAIPAPPRLYAHPRVSPDGTRVAAFVAEQDLDVWLWDLTRPPLTRVTYGPGADSYPLWTRDGHRLIFSSQRTGVMNLFWQTADGAGAVERLTESNHAQTATGISRDGGSLIFTEVTPTTGEDVMRMMLDGHVRLRRWCSQVSPSGMGSCHPTAAGWPTKPTTPAGSRFLCVRFPTSTAPAGRCPMMAVPGRCGVPTVTSCSTSLRPARFCASALRLARRGRPQQRRSSSNLGTSHNRAIRVAATTSLATVSGF
jgi:hypothetical protein